MPCFEEQNPCPETPEVPQYDSSQIFYHINCDADLSALTQLDLPNGTSLETFMESVDLALRNSNAFNFATFNMECLKNRYTINNMSQFVTAMDEESCRLDTAYTQMVQINESIVLLQNSYNAIAFPAFSTNGCNLGILPDTGLIPAVQSLIYHYCNFVANLSIPVSPSIVGINNSSIVWSNAGVLNHELTASVKISQDANNALVQHLDGLYVPVAGTPNANQTLAWNAGTNQLSISGGNTVTIAFPGAQVLSLAGNILSLSGGGGSVNLGTIIAPAFTETALIVTSSNPALSFSQSGTSNHTLNLKIEKDTTTNSGNNLLQITTTGLYVPTPAPINGLTYVSGATFKLGGALIEDTEIDLSNKELLIKSTSSNGSFRFSDTKGLEIFQFGAPLTKTQIGLDNDDFTFRSVNGLDEFEFIKVRTWNGSALKSPRLFLGVNNTLDDAGQGSRVNVDGSFGMVYHSTTAATYNLNENHAVFVYLGQAVPGALDLHLPDPTTSVGFGGGNMGWSLWIKNYATDVADVINPTYDIYLDNTNIVSVINPGEAFHIIAINGKWVKFN